MATPHLMVPAFVTLAASSLALFRVDELMSGLKQQNKISSTGLNQTMQAGGGFLNDGFKFTGYQFVGYNNYMQSSSSCQTDPKTDSEDKHMPG